MRRYDLDWLRVLVFGLLIFYHVGMFFVPWEWHIKNNRVYEWLEVPMLFVNQWPLPILFVISGMGTSYALARRNGRQFITERIKRLFIPLVVGIAFIVPPQVYFERVASGAFSGSFWEFWPVHAFLGVYPEGNFSWHHLWFLPYLLVFSVVLTPLFLYLRQHPNNGLIHWLENQLKKPIGFIWFLIPLFMTQVFLRPFFPATHALIGDWYVLIYYGAFFLYGFVLIMMKEVFWNAVQNHRKLFLSIGISAFSLWMLLIFGFHDQLWSDLLQPLVRVINTWSWILALFGFAAHYLNKRSSVLSYANEAVYPFYILHQTITVLLAFYLRDIQWSFGQKALLLVVGTFVISWLLYEYLIRRMQLLRPLFGLKPEKRKKSRSGVGEIVPERV